MSSGGGAILRVVYDDAERFEGLTEEDYPHEVHRESSVEVFLGSRSYWRLKDPSVVLPRSREELLEDYKSGRWKPGEDERPYAYVPNKHEAGAATSSSSSGPRKRLIEGVYPNRKSIDRVPSESNRKRAALSPTPDPKVKKSSIKLPEPVKTIPGQPPVKRRRTTVTKPVIDNKKGEGAPSEGVEPPTDEPTTEPSSTKEKPA